MSEPRHPENTAGKRSRGWIIIWVVLGVFIAAGIALGIALGTTTPAVKPSPSASATEPTSPAPTASEEPSATAEAGSPHPDDCRDIYSEAMFSSLDSPDFPLNDPLLIDSRGSNDEVLVGLLDEDPGLHCSWGMPSEFGINTNIVHVDTATHDLVRARLAQEGFICSEERGGELCAKLLVGPGTEGWVNGDLQAGESHFFRDDVWIATHWGGGEMKGYTEDIASTLWP